MCVCVGGGGGVGGWVGGGVVLVLLYNECVHTLVHITRAIDKHAPLTLEFV